MQPITFYTWIFSNVNNITFDMNIVSFLKF